MCLMCISDVGADVLDLAETMVASDGLKYEPVSNELCSRIVQEKCKHTKPVSVLVLCCRSGKMCFVSYFRSTLNSPMGKDCGKCKVQPENLQVTSILNYTSANMHGNIHN